MQSNDPPSVPRFGSLVGSVYRQWRRWMDHSSRAHGLTDANRMPLVALLDHGAPMRQNALAEAITLEPTSMFRLIRELEGRDLIHCAVDTEDRRARQISLTASGQIAARKVLAQSQALETAILADIAPEDLATTRRVLETILQHLQTQDRTSP